MSLHRNDSFVAVRLDASLPQNQFRQWRCIRVKSKRQELGTSILQHSHVLVSCKLFPKPTHLSLCTAAFTAAIHEDPTGYEPNMGGRSRTVARGGPGTDAYRIARLLHASAAMQRLFASTNLCRPVRKPKVAKPALGCNSC